MIPKKIHYCWFGRGAKQKLALKCLASWRKFCPDYEIIEWNEDNVNLEEYPYLKWCYENRKWAFLSDFVRLLAVYKHGGIYLDTDVEVIKSFDDLLDCQAFYGFETDDFVNSGHAFGAEAKHSSVLSMIKQYEQLTANKNGDFELISCPKLNTEALLPLGLKQNGKYQELIDGTIIYPAEYFNPYNDPTGILSIADRTYSIHWYSKSWISKTAVFRSILTRPLHRLFGENFFRKYKH